MSTNARAFPWGQELGSYICLTSFILSALKDRHREFYSFAVPSLAIRSTLIICKIAFDSIAK